MIAGGFDDFPIAQDGDPRRARVDVQLGEDGPSPPIPTAIGPITAGNSNYKKMPPLFISIR